ncbi:multiple sugar transport system substrate-binding protein [Psychromicrobium silvestre]|uniref:Multiple sugar transport system substrate-binding protein n=1 Tax=Psychromicrobium silvestre TaxID=1645614 RepID=A0A7Y9LV46_9MICC|nr:extracellular solute-binding protein [Psychromicrobium silvestre]NYE96159.1 multiple sugar transport system substrate-binding protein [Psychromicrobium silvestre]
MRFGQTRRLASRGLAVATVVTLSALTLSACGSSDGGSTNGSGKTLDVLVNVNTLYPDQQKQWMDDMSSKFKAETGAELKYETFTSANDELTKIQTSVVSGQGPDVYSLGTTFTPTAYATKAFVTLSSDDWTKVGGKDRFNQATLGISGPDAAHQVGVPFVSRPFVLAYNKDMLKAAGFDKPATSWDGLLEQAKKMTGNGKYGMAVGYKDNFDPWKFIWAMSTQAGNPLVDGSKAKLDDPAVKKAYETYFGWLSKDKVVDPASVGWTNSQALAAFSQGKTGFMLMTTASSIVSLDKSALAGKYAFGLMPTTAPGQSTPGSTPAASILSGDNLVVADYSQQKDLAFAYIKLATSKEEQLNYNKIFGDLPANAEALKSLTDPKLAPITDAATKSFATPFTGAWGDIQLALTNVVVQSIPDLSQSGVSDASLQQLLSDAQSKAQSSLDRAAKG